MFTIFSGYATVEIMKKLDFALSILEMIRRKADAQRITHAACIKSVCSRKDKDPDIAGFLNPLTKTVTTLYLLRSDGDDYVENSFR